MNNALFTWVGITAKRTKHLARPYTTCTTENMEMQLQAAEIREVLGNATPAAGEGVIQEDYSLIDCR